MANYLYKSLIRKYNNYVERLLDNERIYLYSNHYSQWQFSIFIFNVSFKEKL